jgi:hypothetical protein
VSYLQKLDMRMNEEHPPLAKVLAAARGAGAVAPVRSAESTRSASPAGTT